MITCLVETCKLNRVELHSYLTSVLATIFNGHEQEDIT